MQKQLINAKKDSKINGENKNLIQCLSTCDQGAELEVIKVDAGQMAKKRLANLGIVPGARIIKKKSAPFNGPVEIVVKGSSLVIGRGLAAKIIVHCEKKCIL